MNKLLKDMDKKDLESLKEHLNAAGIICARYEDEGNNCSAAMRGTGAIVDTLLKYVEEQTDINVTCGCDKVSRYIAQMYQRLPGPVGLIAKSLSVMDSGFSFSCMLERLFPDGSVVWCTSNDDIAFMYDGNVYTAGGERRDESEMLVPVHCLNKRLSEILSVPEPYNEDAALSLYRNLQSKFNNRKKMYADMLRPYKGKKWNCLYDSMSKNDLYQAYLCYRSPLSKSKVVEDVARELSIMLLAGAFDEHIDTPYEI